ncbi:MAG: beta-N-acetylhexosaminidase [Roseovarius sp.]|nr:beta-N-acetylhexosaminidase [Roseovarius sp.]
MSRFGACILDAECTSLTRDEKSLFKDVRPFGFILFARNIQYPSQVRALCHEMREAAGHDALIAIDQEGGRVQRLGEPYWREWPPPLEFVAKAGRDAEEAMYMRYRIIASELHDLGIYSNCAPLVDVAWPSTHAFLKNRCYGYTPDSVAKLGRAAASGLLGGGVLPVIKHIPGHGRSQADSHFELPRVDVAIEQLEKTDFIPFQYLNDMPLAMTAHIVYSRLGAEPATVSKSVVDVIRNKIGFDGLLMTDDISMKALSGSATETAKESLKAGCDVILHCNGSLAERTMVANASGEMSEMAQKRAESALNMRGSPDDADIEEMEAKLQTLLS